MYYSQLRQALDEMPEEFSSNEYSLLAREKGVSDKSIKTGILARFLHKEAIQISRRVWKKKGSNKEVSVNNNTPQDVEGAIKLLKSKGYRIMKPIFEEI